jgi:hypothetical protein
MVVKILKDKRFSVAENRIQTSSSVFPLRPQAQHHDPIEQAASLIVSNSCCSQVNAEQADLCCCTLQQSHNSMQAAFKTPDGWKWL